MFSNHGDVALRDMVSGHGRDGLMAGHDGLKRSFPTLMTYDYMGGCDGWT